MNREGNRHGPQRLPEDKGSLPSLKLKLPPRGNTYFSVVFGYADDAGIGAARPAGRAFDTWRPTVVTWHLVSRVSIPIRGYWKTSELCAGARVPSLSATACSWFMIRVGSTLTFIVRPKTETIGYGWPGRF